MGRRPFAGIEKDIDKLSPPREPFLIPRRVVRDNERATNKSTPEMIERSNIVSSTPAIYYLSIDECTLFETQNNADAFKAMFTVVASDGLPGEGTNEIGSKAVWMNMATHKGFKRDMITFICNALNFSPARVKESHFEAMISRSQPLTAKKRHIMAKVENVKTKEAKTDFTKHTWSPIEIVNDEIVLPSRNEVLEFIRENGEIKA